MFLFLLVVALLCQVGIVADEGLWNLDRGEILDNYLADPKPVIVIDLDDTVAPATLFNNFLLFTNPLINLGYSQFVQPLNMSPEMIQELSTTYHIVFVTARAKFLAEISMDWLDLYGFPPAPLFTAQNLFISLQATGYKSAAIQYVMDLGLVVEYGIGDKSGDIQAYTDKGLKYFLILEGFDDGDLAPCLEVFEPRTLPSLDPGDPGPELITFDHDEAWSIIAEYLTAR